MTVGALRLPLVVWLVARGALAVPRHGDRCRVAAHALDRGTTAEMRLVPKPHRSGARRRGDLERERKLHRALRRNHVRLMALDAGHRARGIVVTGGAVGRSPDARHAVRASRPVTLPARDRLVALVPEWAPESRRPSRYDGGILWPCDGSRSRGLRPRRSGARRHQDREHRSCERPHGAQPDVGHGTARHRVSSSARLTCDRVTAGASIAASATTGRSPVATRRRTRS